MAKFGGGVVLAPPPLFFFVDCLEMGIGHEKEERRILVSEKSFPKKLPWAERRRFTLNSNPNNHVFLCVQDEHYVGV